MTLILQIAAGFLVGSIALGALSWIVEQVVDAMNGR